MSTNRQSDDQNALSKWGDCPEGQLSLMVRKLRAKQARARTRKLVQTGVVSMVLVACGVVVVGSLTSSNGMSIGGISCPECVSRFAEYHGHVTGVKQLENAELATSMATHLANCQTCQSQFSKTYPGVLESADAERPGFHPLLAISRQSAYY